MKDAIKKYLKDFYTIEVSDTTIEKFSQSLTHKKFLKGDVVVEFGKPTSKFYILTDGIVGSFVKNKQNNKFIRTLYTNGKVFGALSSLIQENIVSNANYTCLTDCNAFEGDFNDFLALTQTSNEFVLIYNKVLEETYVRTEKKIDDLCLLNATERYLKLLQEIPDICNLLPQYQIANYLNITPVQLSRIRKNLLF